MGIENLGLGGRTLKILTGGVMKNHLGVIDKRDEKGGNAHLVITVNQWRYVWKQKKLHDMTVLKGCYESSVILNDSCLEGAYLENVIIYSTCSPAPAMSSEASPQNRGPPLTLLEQTKSHLWLLISPRVLVIYFISLLKGEFLSDAIYSFRTVSNKLSLEFRSQLLRHKSQGQR